MVRVASSFTLELVIPFPVRDFDMRNVSRIERDVCKAPDFANDRASGNGNVLNDATVAQRDRNDLVVHACLRLREQELAPFFRQRGHTI